MEQSLPSVLTLTQTNPEDKMSSMLSFSNQESLSLHCMSENNTVTNTLEKQSDITAAQVEVKVEYDQDASSLVDLNIIETSPHSYGDATDEFLDLGQQVKKEVPDDLTGLIPPVEMEDEFESNTHAFADEPMEDEFESNTHAFADESLNRRKNVDKRKNRSSKQSMAGKRKANERNSDASSKGMECSAEQCETTEKIISTKMKSDVPSKIIKCSGRQRKALEHRCEPGDKAGKSRGFNKLQKEELFRCETCGKEFQRSDLLTDHVKIHRRPKPYTCDHCQMKFAKPSYLKLHLRRHAGDRPFPCDQCEKRFFDMYDLRVHQRDHTGERPYICSECGKGFKRIYILNKHKRTHSKERPFQCSVCGKAYRYGYSYRLHMKDH
ncbi:zinc finger protein 329 [Myxocyprinus asiaticus]|uniref:zinc finger protein 329 n=1 Tax=Myxocyprinus asiaticus TaxID=70543 RepID=UPI002221BC8C|nr:zinc finger protein 329 [Myxocyprinus asiaticus]